MAASTRRRVLLAVAATMSGVSGRAACAQTGELVAPDALRVCADPSNLPFSNERGEGFENSIAQIVGQALNLPVRYVFFPQVPGFVRNTLNAYRCDLVMGTVSGDSTMQNTNPYYHTTQVMVYRSQEEPPPTDFDDPRMRAFRIGVIARTPPVDLLVRHGLLSRLRSYPLVVDTRHDAPGLRMMHDIAAGEIDMGMIGGPVAGYAIRVRGLPLALRPLPSEPGLPRMDYRITMGVRPNEPEWRRRINAVIRDRQAEITAVLRDYGVPLLDASGKLIPP